MIRCSPPLPAGSCIADAQLPTFVMEIFLPDPFSSTLLQIFSTGPFSLFVVLFWICSMIFHLATGPGTSSSYRAYARRSNHRRSVVARTSRRPAGSRVAHNRMTSVYKGFYYEIKNPKNGARIF